MNGGEAADRACGRSGPARLGPARSGEAGFVLLFALFVIIVLMVVTAQLSFSSRIDRDIARNTVQEFQMEELARAGIWRGRTALLTDLDEDKGGGDAGADSGSAPDGASGGAPDGAAGGAGGAGGDGQSSGPHVDSLDESWASGQITLTPGEEAGYRTRIVITDEDAKLNLLLLLAEDPDYRKLWKERFSRALDLMRDGMPQDLSGSDADDYLGRFTNWMEGDRPDDEISTAPLATTGWKGEGDRAVYAPLSLREFSLTGQISDALYYGFPTGNDDERKWVPGFEQTLTVFSNLEYVEPKADGETTDDSVTPPEGAKPKTRSEAPGVNNGRININTAPVWVLKSLFPDGQIAASAWDDYAAFRKQKLDDKKKERDDFLSDGSGTTKLDPKDEPGPDEPIYPLKTVDDLRRFKGFSPEGGIAPDVWSKLAELLTVESNVFTVTVIVGTTELPRRFYVARSVVWRRGGKEQPCVPIVPFEKLPLTAVDLDDFAKELDNWTGN